MCFQLPANVYREINMLKRHKLLNQQHLKLSRAAQELNKDLKQDHKRDNKEKRFSRVKWFTLVAHWLYKTVTTCSRLQASH